MRYRPEKTREALRYRGFLESSGIHWNNIWCRGPDSNRQAVRRRIFVTPRLSTPRTLAWARVRALDYAFAIAARRVRTLRAALGAPRLVSTPSAPPLRAAAGLARRCLGARR
jgi:hypothetical protein